MVCRKVYPAYIITIAAPTPTIHADVSFAREKTQRHLRRVSSISVISA